MSTLICCPQCGNEMEEAPPRIKAKVIFCSPTYGTVDPQALRSQRAAIMHAAANGYQWVGDASPDRMKFDAARNTSAQLAIQSGADYAFWCDSDIVLPTSAITKLLDHKLDFVTGIYYQRTKPHWPLIATFNGKSFEWCVSYPENVVAPMDGCGFGCVVTSIDMLKRMEENGRKEGENGWFCYRQFSEDFDFCLRAKEAGSRLYVDTTVKCGHLADPTPVTEDTYRKAHPELFQEIATGPTEG